MPEGYPPCPGCGEVGFSVQVWHEGEQQWQCNNDDCRVSEYSPREGDRQDPEPGAAF